LRNSASLVATDESISHILDHISFSHAAGEVIVGRPLTP
jgi:hypothetical protein